MKLISFCALPFLIGALQAQTPAIASGGIYNTASYVPTGLPSAAIAQGSLFVVFGSGMGPATLASAPALPLTTSLNGTSLSVTVGGTTTKPYMFYTSAGQVGAIMPSNTPAGTGTMTVSFNGQTSATQPVQVAASSFGIFSVNQAGSGPGIITNAKYAVNTLTTAASAGDVNIIWGTGLGPVGNSGSEAAGTATLAAIPSTFKVYVGGVSATIVGAARSSSPGLDQIAFTVPAGVTGCHVPVTVQTNNVVSNFVSMAIAVASSNGICSDPVNTGLTPTQLSMLQQQGTVSQGSIGLSRTAISIALSGAPLPTMTTDSGSASFYRYTFQQYTAATGGVNVSTYGACSVFYATGSSSTPADPTVATPLDAGSAITVSSTGGGSKTLTQSTPGIYSATLGSNTSSLYLSPGTYTITGPGGKDVGPINTSITLPPPLTWTNAGSITSVNRANGQLVTWTGGDPNGTVEIVGISTAGTTTNPVTVGFECAAQDSATQFTIPAIVLLSLPPSSAVSGGFGFLEVGAAAATKNFTATGLDLGYLGATFITAQTVSYQ